ncbi:MAG: hypothetical protein J6R82_00140 [Clostridia bacterium]|nr:hypothetical protein [Clostridia bacterium]
MKKLTKWLTLLLAGLVLCATLFACDDGFDWSEEEEDDEEESESFDQYKKLSPEELWNALMEAKDYTISIQVSRTMNEQSGENNIFVEKDGGKVKLTGSATTPDGASYDNLAYCDLDKQTFYEQLSDGTWDVEQDEDITLEVMLKDELETSFLFLADLYGEYNADTRSYPMIAEKLIAAMDAPEDTIASGSMTRNGTTYTFIIETEQGGTRQTVEYIFTFQSVTVKFPAELAPETDDNQPGETPSVSQKPAVSEKPDAPQPPVTETPDVPQPPVTVAPEVPVEPELPAYDTPAQAYLNALDASSMSLQYVWESGSQTQIMTLYKYNNILYIIIDEDDRFMESYMDLQTGYLYTTDINGNWCYEYSDSVVDWDVIISNLFTYGMQIFTEDAYTVFEDDRYIATEDAMERLSQYFNIEILDASMQYDEYDNIYSYEYLEYNSVEGVFNSIGIDLCFDTYYLYLPDAYEKGENDDEDTDDDETPDYDYSAYENLTPDELYKSMLTTTELYFFFEVNGNQVVITRSGDWVELHIYTYSTGKIQTYYQDLVNNTLYQRISNSYYEKVDYYYTWSDLIDMAIAQAKTTYYLQNDCYVPFTEDSPILELDPNRTPCSVRNAILTRSSYYYHFEGTLEGEFIYFTIEFDNQEVEIPF